MKRFQVLFEICIILLFSLTPLLWLKSGEAIVGHDSGVRLAPAQYLKQLTTTWDTTNNFGVDTSLTRGFLLTQLPEIVSTMLFRPFFVGQEASFIFWFFAMGISMYICIRGFFPQPEFWILRLYASLYWIYNFYILQGWFITERAKFSLFAALPLAFLITRKALTKTYALIPASVAFGFVFFFLNGGGSPPLYGAVLLMLFIVFVSSGVKAVIFRSRTDLMWIVKVAALFFIVVVCMNMYWLLPQMYLAFRSYGAVVGSAGGLEGVLSWEQSVNQNASFINLVRLQGIPNWYKNEFHPYAAAYLTNPLLILASFGPIAVIVIGALKKLHIHPKKKQFAWEDFHLFLLLFFFGLFFAAGSHDPTGPLYVLLVRYVPGFIIFRSAIYKFAPVLWFSIIVLSGYYLNLFALLYKDKRYVVYGIGIVVLVGILLFHYPYFSSAQFNWNKPFTTKVTIPSYVPAMMQYIDSHTGADDRILLLPEVDPQFHADSYIWGFWSIDMLMRLYVPKAGIVVNDVSSPYVVSGLYNAIRRNNETDFRTLAEKSGITGLLWRDDVLYDDKITTTKNIAGMKDTIERWRTISKEYQQGAWTFYRLNIQPSNVFRCSNGLAVRDDAAGNAYRPVDGLETIGNLEFSRIQADLEPLVDTEIVRAACYFCEPDALEKLENQMSLIYPRFLPDSPFYGLTQLKELVQEKRIKDPALMVETQLIYATKRLVEVGELAKRDQEDNREELSRMTIVRYREHIARTFSAISLLTGNRKNDEYGKMLSTIRAHQKYINAIEERRSISQDMLEQLHESLDAWVQQIEHVMYLSTAVKKYFSASVPVADVYAVTVDDPESPTNVLLDGKNVTNAENIFLEAGEHKFEIQYEEQRNLLEMIAQPDLELRMPFGATRQFAINNLNDQDTYMLSFTYKVVSGSGPLFSVQQVNDPQQNGWQKQRIINQVLIDDGKLYSFEQAIKPRFGSDGFTLIFSSRSAPSLPSSVIVSKLSLKRVVLPKLTLVRNTHEDATKQIYIHSKQLSPTAFIVQSPGPCFLVSTIQYDTGWKALRIPSTFSSLLEHPGILGWMSIVKSILQRGSSHLAHVKVNDYANAWYIPAGNTSAIIIVYVPQVFFIASLVISSLSIIACVVILICQFL